MRAGRVSPTIFQGNQSLLTSSTHLLQFLDCNSTRSLSRKAIHFQEPIGVLPLGIRANWSAHAKECNGGANEEIQSENGRIPHGAAVPEGSDGASAGHYGVDPAAPSATFGGKAALAIA